MASIKIILERMSKMRKTERNFTNKVLESKRGDVQAVKSKIKSSVMATAFLFAATIPIGLSVPAGNVQAAAAQQKQVKKVNQKVKTNTSKAIQTIESRKVTSSTMIKAYKKYLRKNVSNKKYYAIVNIGDNNAPVLLRGTQGAGNDKTGRHYTGCQIYYYKNGKVVKMDTFKDGGRWLLLSQKKMDRITLQTAVQISLSEFVLKMETYTDINIITIITGKRILKINGQHPL